MQPKELVLGEKSLTILHALPHFNGIKLRIPKCYVINALTSKKVEVTAQIRAVATMISAVLARRFTQSNINLQVSFNHYLPMLSNFYISGHRQWCTSYARRISNSTRVAKGVSDVPTYSNLSEPFQ